MMIPKNYLYLDKSGIRSLYSQLRDKFETESIEKLKKDNNKKISGKFGLGKVLGVLLGLTEIDVSGELNFGSAKESEIHFKLSFENQLDFIIKKLSELGEPNIFLELPKAAKYSRENKDATFILIRDQFDAPQFYSGTKGIEAVNNEGAFLFTKDMDPFDSYRYRDDYYKYEPVPVTMAASATKFTRSNKGHFGYTSHEALMFGNSSGKNITFRIFGIIFPVNKNFQIKPYAIW